MSSWSMYGTVFLLCLIPICCLGNTRPSVSVNDEAMTFGINQDMKIGVTYDNDPTTVNELAFANDVDAVSNSLHVAVLEMTQKLVTMNNTMHELQVENSRLRELVTETNTPTTSSPTAQPTSAPTPTPTQPTVVGDLGSHSNPALNCRSIWEASAMKSALAPPSGAYWIDHSGGVSPFQVYCEMSTRTSTGKSGWTMCAKYDRNLAGADRWLSQGFGRSATDALSMQDLRTFESKWESIDCRPLLDMQSSWMMHAGSNTASNFNKILFTNIMLDTKMNSTNFFDVDRVEVGECVPRATGGIVTYTSDWDAAIGQLSGDGACVIGDGHHLCTVGREPAFSNARHLNPPNKSAADCGGSADDTVFWAWNGDNHNCANLVIGTGCNVNSPRFRYNYLFIH